MLATRTGVYSNRLMWPWSFKTPTWRTLLDSCWSTQRPTSSSTWPFTMGRGVFTGRSQGSTPHKPSRSSFLVTPQRKSTRKSGWARLWLAFRPKTKVWPEQHSLHCTFKSMKYGDWILQQNDTFQNSKGRNGTVFKIASFARNTRGNKKLMILFPLQYKSFCIR